MAKTRMIKTLDELIELVKNSDRLLYIRWTGTPPAKDIKRRASYNNATHSYEGGLSVEPLQPIIIKVDCEGFITRVVRDEPQSWRGFVARAVRMYKISSIYRYGYVLTGPVVGTGGDGEPVLGEGRELIATLSINVIRQARGIDPYTGEKCKHPQKMVYNRFCCHCGSLVDE